MWSTLYEKGQSFSCFNRECISIYRILGNIEIDINVSKCRRQKSMDKCRRQYGRE
jgi:hypothetical protein